MNKEQNILMWKKCVEILRDNLDAEQFNAWFAPIVAVSYENDELKLKLPSQFFVQQIEQNYFQLFSATLRRVYGSSVKLFYTYNIIEDTPSSSVTIEHDHSSAKLNSSVTRQTQQLANPFEPLVMDDIDPQLNPRYTFENYCGSMSNKLAVSVGKAIAEDPNCKTFNPMFVFGPTGVGKTHLIQAIGIKIKELRPRTRVLYTTSRIFELQYTTAVKNNKVNDFISFYQSIDVLILDDIQELAGKQGTQNAFFHIFNHLHQNQKQLIMSSDCRPSDMDGMVPRLISRFKWGMTVELYKPDYELRRGVLKMKASQDGLSLDDEIIDFIAQNVTESVRDLEGIVVALLAHATMLNQDISLDLAQSVVGNTVNVNKKQMSFELITETVCRFYNIDKELIYGKSRKREISDARQLVMYLTKKSTQMSSTNIGQKLSRDHATMLHACKQIEQRLSIEKKFRHEVEMIENELR
ncbi:MAG: chromosomal replication initiator protein DnaA [Muribaculaceae bacterium]|nr:chromosomal replication initiator protein DnaA [Muribaculaceae bacterium]